MKHSFFLPALSLFASLSLAWESEPLGCPFKLKPAANAPAEIAGLGGVTWDHVVNGNLGWLYPNSDVVRLNMNSDSGPAVYSSYDPLNLSVSLPRPCAPPPRIIASLR